MLAVMHIAGREIKVKSPNVRPLPTPVVVEDSVPGRELMDFALHLAIGDFWTLGTFSGRTRWRWRCPRSNFRFFTLWSGLHE